ncbi:PcfJ domain-containing protein [Aquimarina sp. 2201CG5-10]|uniref:PcfJ domain-containing protein n=1 Tax=Aquimarina callyspongiae TaxID=3098150 RepID=UPI002AB50B11|nr:PcfJ domain-containing protein [Aquimarina sp. 2201CG5-10]MDY8138750.1 PcfJ domain-containing protein [Aquimarina sp. 2201CG5-10]
METLLEKKVNETTYQSKNITVYTSKYASLVEVIYTAHNKPQDYKGTIASMLWMFFSKMSKKRSVWKRDTFRKLLLHLHDQGCYTILRKIEYVEVLANISAFGNRFVRDIYGWKKETYIAEDQLQSLIEFCFAKYPVPEFLVSSFFETQKKYMLWYVQLGVGRSVKSLSGIEMQLTTKMAHEFRKTPKGYSVAQALRRAQAIGYGANKNMAESIAWSGLSRVRGNESFWNTVVHFFAKQKEAPFDKMGEIIDYLSFSIRENTSFSMKGRTLEALLRQSDEWHRRLYMQRNAENYVSWKSAKIKSLNYTTAVKDQSVVFKTVELLNSQALYEEGYDMHHCAASYVDECYSGESAIFSLRKYMGDSFEKLATIEIDPESKEVLQAEGKYNSSLTKEASKALEVWKEQADLDYENYASPPPQEYRPQVNGGDQLQNINARNEMQTMNREVEISPKVIVFIIYIIIRLMMLMV